MNKFFKLLAAGSLACLPFGAHATYTQATTLGGPEVMKIDWNTRGLASGDMDGDGLTDLVLINNDESRIEILYQKGDRSDVETKRKILRKNRWEPELEDTQFIRESIVTGLSMYSLAVGDLNNDGQEDLVYSSKRDPLVVLYQDEKNTWKDKEEYDSIEALPWGSTIAVADLNGDGLKDLVVLGKEKLLIVHQDKQAGLGEPKELFLGNNNHYGLKLFDVDGDGRLDILYLVGSNDRALRVRLQDAESGFGPELRFPLKVKSGHVIPVKGEKENMFASLQSKTGLIEFFKIEHTDDVAGKPLEDLFPQVYPAGQSKGSEKAAYALADFDEDGVDELAISDADGARILIYKQVQPGVWGGMVDYPTFAGVSKIAVINSFGEAGKPGLVVFSAEEKMLGITQFNEKERLRFPKVIATKGEPQALAISDIDVEPDGLDEIILVEKEGRDLMLTILTRSEQTDPFEVSVEIELDGLKRSPSDILIADFNHDGVQDIFLVIPREDGRFLFRNEAGEFEEVLQESALRKNILSDLNLARLGFGDVNGDGQDEFLVAGKGFIRALTVNSEQALEVVDQFNARRSDDELKLPLVFDFDQDGQDEIVVYAIKDETVQVMEQDEQGLYRYNTSLDVGAMQPITAQLMQIETKKKKGWGKKRKANKTAVTKSQQLIVFGEKEFWVVPLAQAGYSKIAMGSYESDLEDVAYNQIEAGDLNGDGLDELLLLDGQNHVTEVLRFSPEDDAWLSSMHFTVFERNLHYGGRQGAPQEPRELLMRDFTGDGKDDLVFLVHDRVLLYPQLSGSE